MFNLLHPSAIYFENVNFSCNLPGNPASHAKTTKHLKPKSHEKNKRLYRSAKSKVFGGVAGGIAEYFDIDPIIIRLLFVIIAFAGGGGAIVYLILWIALPLEPITPFSMNMGAGDPFGPAEGSPGGSRRYPSG